MTEEDKMRNFLIVLCFIFSATLDTPAVACVNQAACTSLADEAIAYDSQREFFNRYDQGSAFFNKMSENSEWNKSFFVDYTYNNGHYGWAEISVD